MDLRHIVAVLVLAACGGGGSPDPVEPAPVAALDEVELAGAPTASEEEGEAQPTPSPQSGAAAPGRFVVRWSVEHRSPDGTVQAHDLATRLSLTAGPWSCAMGSARSGTRMIMQNGQVEYRMEERRELTCRSDAGEESIAVSCGHGSETAPPADSATVLLDDGGRPHAVELRCEVEAAD